MFVLCFGHVQICLWPGQGDLKLYWASIIKFDLKWFNWTQVYNGWVWFDIKFVKLVSSSIFQLSFIFDKNFKLFIIKKIRYKNLKYTNSLKKDSRTLFEPVELKIEVEYSNNERVLFHCKSLYTTRPGYNLYANGKCIRKAWAHPHVMHLTNITNYIERERRVHTRIYIA